MYPQREGKLTPQLVPLLAHACTTTTASGENRMIALLLALQDIHVQRVIELRDTSEHSNHQLRRLVQELGLSSDPNRVGPADMIREATCIRPSTSPLAHTLAPPPTLHSDRSARTSRGASVAGFSPAEEPFLRHKVAMAIEKQLERLGSGRVNAPGSHYFLGIPDFTGSLKEGEVAAVVGSSSFEEEVLVYRAPGTHAGDVRRARAVQPPAGLRKLLAGACPQQQNALFFSVHGERALADCLSGGDYDGDEFLGASPFEALHTHNTSSSEAFRWFRPSLTPPLAAPAVLRSSHKFDLGPSEERCSIVDAFDRESEPWDGATPGAPPDAPKPKPIPDEVAVGRAEAASETCTQLIQHYLDCVANVGTIGKASNTVELAIEAWGPGSAKVDFLVGCYNGALDAGKAGGQICTRKLEEFRRTLDGYGVPEFIKPNHPDAKVQPFGSSKSALAKLWRNAKAGCSKAAATGQAPSMDKDLECAALPECAYCQEPFGRGEIKAHEKACRLLYAHLHHDLPPRRAERLPGPGAWSRQQIAMYEKWTVLNKSYGQEMQELFRSDGGAKNGDGVKSEGWSTSYNAIIARYQEKLLGKYDDYEREHPPDALLLEASMLYAVCYNKAGATNARFDRDISQGLSFAWQVAGPLLCYLKASKVHHRAQASTTMRLTDTSVVNRLLGSTKNVSRRAQEATDPDAGEQNGAEEEGGACDDEFASTPWSRCG